VAACARAAWSLLFLATTVSASPFATRDQNPLIADFGLPASLPARLPDAGWSLGGSFNWSSSAIAQAEADEALVADVETRELRLVAARRVGERFAFQLQLPYRYVGPGVLDGFIDDWHELFGLPEGARPLLPEDQMLIVYERQGERILDERSSDSGVANMSADLGVQLASTERSNAALWLSVKLPTSTLDLPGHDTTDAALSIVADHRLSPRWMLYAQASLAALGEDDALSGFQKSTVWSGHAGVTTRAWGNLDLKLQVDGHTAAVESSLDYLGDAVVLTFGGSYELVSGWRIDLGISEDISIDASPDVVFVLAVQRTSTRR
jgi:hypothetical protein